MRFFCPACGTSHNRSDDDVPPAGMTIPCAKCGYAIQLKPPRKRETLSAAEAAGSRPPATRPRAPLRSAPPIAEAPVREEPEPADSTEPSLEAVEADLSPEEPVPSLALDDEPTPQPEPDPPVSPARTKPSSSPAGEAEQPPKPTVRRHTKPQPKPLPSAPPKPGKAERAGAWFSGLPYPGCGRSDPKCFRFRDLFWALQAPLDARKTLVAGVGVMIGSLLFAGVVWLGLLAHTGVIAVLGTLIGSLLLWACTFLALGLVAHQTDAEMSQGGRLPLKEGFDFLRRQAFTVLGGPLGLMLAAAVLGAGVAVLSLLARIPVAGPVLYGMTFPAAIGLAILAVGIGLLLLLLAFSYVPAIADGDGPMAPIRRAWGELRRRPGRYLLHLLVATIAATLLLYLWLVVLGQAFSLIGWLGGQLGGREVSAVFLGIPVALFGWLVWLLPGSWTGVFAPAAGAEWQYTVGGWLVGLTLLLIVSLVLGFVLVYWSAAGVVNHRLLEQESEDPAGK